MSHLSPIQELEKALDDYCLVHIHRNKLLINGYSNFIITCEFHDTEKTEKEVKDLVYQVIYKFSEYFVPDILEIKTIVSKVISVKFLLNDRRLFA